MTVLPLMLAVALSAGNAEFDLMAQHGAASIAVRRVEAELAEKGPPAGALERAMLEGGAPFASREAAKEACRDVFEAALKRAFEEKVRGIRDRLNLGETFRPMSPFPGAEDDKLFEAAFARERKSACEKQAKGIAGAVRPSEADFETKDEAALRKEMTKKVAAQQKGVVFEENLKYISEAIVDPVIDSAKREMKRQREYLMRTKCEAYAPSALARELEENLRRNVGERKAKETDPSKAWDAFPETLRKGVPAATARRTLERVTRCADDVPVKVDAKSISAEIARSPKAHRKASDSEKAFRRIFAKAVLDGAIARVEQEAPAKERKEFAEYVRAHADDAAVAKAVEARVRRELLPALGEVRAEIARADFARGWAQLADGTWYPDAELADAVSARSDYAKAVAGWRKIAELSDLSLAGSKAVRLEETDALADEAVADAFGRARNAIVAQNAILTAAEPWVLGETKERKESFWRMTPDYGKIVEMLTEVVEDKWNDVKVKTLWSEDERRPGNAKDQHAALFPSVRRRIELIAKSILEEMEKPKDEEKAETDPEKKPEEEPTAISIVVRREGDQVTVKLEQGKSTVVERSARAKMSDYRKAMKDVADRLGKDILELK